MFGNCLILCGTVFAVFSTAVGCKKNDAELMTASSTTSGDPSVSQKYEWCKASPAAWQGLVEAISQMEKAGQSSIGGAAGTQAQPAPLSASVVQLMNNPPSAEPPPCGDVYDRALVDSKQQVQVALEGKSDSVAFGFGGCEIANSSGVMSITRLSSGHYRIEILGCGGRQHSEIIVSPTQLKSLGGTLLRGV